MRDPLLVSEENDLMVNRLDERDNQPLKENIHWTPCPKCGMCFYVLVLFISKISHRPLETNALQCPRKMQNTTLQMEHKARNVVAH